MTETSTYKVYPRRWAVLMCVCFVNISNAAIWISFFPVATMTAEYFGKSSADINWFSSVFMIIPMLCFFITTYISNAKGLKFMVHIGCLFNFVGAVIKAFGISPLIDDKDTQYSVTLVGQCIAAVAQTFTIYVPTKVSLVWFPEKERWLITTLLSLSYSLGIVLTELLTPFIITSSSQIPTINYICVGIATAVQIFTLVSMTRSSPKTPPSKAAHKKAVPYIQQLKDTFSSRPFVCLLIIMSIGVGFIAGLNTLTQQIICTVGYSNKLAGSLIFIMYGAGYIGAFVVQPIVERFDCHENLIRISVACFSLGYIAVSEVVLIPNNSWALILFYAFFGWFAVGIFPIGLEMSVEATYPVDESITTGLVYLFGQIFALIIIAIFPALAREDSGKTSNDCDLDFDQVPLDYSISVSVAMVLLCSASMGALIFYKQIFKRKAVEHYEKDLLSSTITQS